MSPTERTTIADVARRAGVSKGLVSFALNDRPGVSPESRERILRIAAELGWKPSLRARSLSTGRSFACGLVIGRSADVIAADPFFHSFIAGLEDVFAMSGQVLVLAVATPGRHESETYRGLASDRRVDGVILTDLRAADERIALVEDLGLTAVTLGRPDLDSPFSSVSVDDGAGIRGAVRHLVGLGHRRIAHVAGPDTMLHSRRRSLAFTAAADAAGITSQILGTDFSAAEGAAATRRLLEQSEPPTAILYSNDHMAVAGLGVVQRMGLRVPDDISITGYDDAEIAGHLHPSLTSVATDAREWGSIVARTLMEALGGAEVAHLTLPDPTLIIRESTGPAPAAPPAPDPKTDNPRGQTRA
jgi:DNA-binding LacI/PurR family transcriptional regulator